MSMAGVDALLDFDDVPASIGGGINIVGTSNAVHGLRQSRDQDPFGEADLMDDFLVSVAIIHQSI